MNTIVMRRMNLNVINKNVVLDIKINNISNLLIQHVISTFSRISNERSPFQITVPEFQVNGVCTFLEICPGKRRKHGGCCLDIGSGSMEVPFYHAMYLMYLQQMYIAQCTFSRNEIIEK